MGLVSRCCLSAPCYQLFHPWLFNLLDNTKQRSSIPTTLSDPSQDLLRKWLKPKLSQARRHQSTHKGGKLYERKPQEAGLQKLHGSQKLPGFLDLISYLWITTGGSPAASTRRSLPLNTRVYRPLPDLELLSLLLSVRLWSNSLPSKPLLKSKGETATRRWWQRTAQHKREW